MNKWTQDQIKQQRIIHQSKRSRNETKWRQIEILNTNSRPSWKTYGDGCSSIKVSAIKEAAGGAANISIVASETALASQLYDQKRDVTKEVHITLTGPAALELYEMLRDTFEPTIDDPR